jgi:hypothetical protein
MSSGHIKGMGSGNGFRTWKHAALLQGMKANYRFTA